MTRATLLAYSATAGAALGVVACWLLLSRAARSSAERGADADVDGVGDANVDGDAADAAALGAGAFASLVGGTPLVELRSLSRATGCVVLAKCEFLSPGGSAKDRVALQAVADAEARGDLRRPARGAGGGGGGGGGPPPVLCEGSSGSTGISLALLARALGYGCCVALPDDQAAEKAALLRRVGCEVVETRPLAFTNAGHYVHVARRRAEQINAAAAAAEAAPPPQGVAAGAAAAADAPAPVLPRAAFFVDQFESESNARAHALHTGPEIWAQTRAWWRARPRRREREDATYAAAAGGGAAGAPTARVGARDRLGAERVDAFVMGAGTGGTLAGVAGFLRRASGGAARAFLVDPPGSALLALVRFGVAFAPQQAERALRRHRSDSVVEGVGLDRVSKNVAAALPLLCGAVPCADAEAVRMARHLLRREGLFLGGSSALNCVGAVKVARKLGPGHTVVTVLCDRGERHVSRFWSDDVLRARGLPVAGREGEGEGGDDEDDDDLSFVRRDDEDGDASNEAVGGAGATGAGAGAGGAKAERDLFKP